MLERIQIENLGPIQKADLTLGDLTVLLGANASGKTTVMRGIKLLSDLQTMVVEYVEYGGQRFVYSNWKRIITRGDDSKRLILRGWLSDVIPGVDARDADVEMQLGVELTNLRSSLFFGTKHKPDFRIELLSDKFRSDPDLFPPSEIEKRNLDGVAHPQPVPMTKAALLSTWATHSPDAQNSKLVQSIERFGTARYFRPHTDTFSADTGDDLVSESGAHFEWALAKLQNQNVELFQAIEKALGESFAHIKRIRFDAQGGIVFETTRAPGLTPARLEAEGVLSTLFLLWAGYTTPEHGTLLLDEPEVGLHPHLMVKRVGFLRDLAEGKVTGHKVRVVVATQSVDFVGFLSLAEVRIVDYDAEKGTQVHPIPLDGRLSDELVGDAWFSGALGGIPGGKR